MMRLSKFNYSENSGNDKHWALEDFCPGPVTLTVGKNATGKSRTLNVISALARTLTTGVPPSEGSFYVEFDDGETRYVLRRHQDIIVEEKLIVAGKTLLSRDAEGLGFVYANEAEVELRFGLSPSQVALFAKRDSVQHPFLEPLLNWGANTRHYRFGESMGRTNLAILRSGDRVPKPDPRDPNHVVGLFANSLKDNPALGEAVCADMNEIGYDLEKVFLHPIPPDIFEPQLNEPLHALAVKESSLACITTQLEMSQGMFRALSLLSLMHIAIDSAETSLILLDDIGEGLDFERALSLISLLVGHAERAGIQLIMSTNDRYVMNAVSLDSWAVLVREGGVCRPITRANAPAAFSEFESTGLANFDFLRLEFWKSAADAEVEPCP